MAIQLVLPMMLVFVTIQEAYAQMLPIALPGCREECGDIVIPYPFGIGADCSANDNFIITCNNSNSSTPPRPILGNTSMEVLRISILLGYISVSNPSIENQKVGSLTIFSDNQTRFTTDMYWYTHLNCHANNSLCGYNTSCSEYGRCRCKDDGHVGNPYTPTGCQAAQSNRTLQYHGGIYGPSYFGHRCYPENKTLVAIIGICSGIGGLISLGVTWWLYKLLQKRKEKKLKEKCFKKNGGLLLQQQISSQGNVERGKVFTSKELEKATDHYNKDRILGQGGQDTVYKGMLSD